MRYRGIGAAFALALAAAALVGCGGHESRVRTALEALDRGAPDDAIAALNQELDVKKPDELPELKGDASLLLLDRATIELSLERYKLSARDFGAADKAIDVLDMKRGTADDVGKYLFSDDVGPYRAPAYEKLLVNTLNMLNYLAQGDTQGAKVEARRLAVMQKFLKERDEDGVMLGLGSYLAGFAFEKAGDAGEALGYYEDALKHAQYPSLKDPLRVLTQGVAKSPGQAALMGDAGPLPPPSETGEGEILVVAGFGRVPQKEAMRIPIGLALTLAAGGISSQNTAQANALAAKGLVTWVNFPTLGKSRGAWSVPTLALDGRGLGMEQALDLEGEVRAAWKRVEGTVIAAAITRTITRVIAGEAAQAAATAAAGRNGGVVGLLVGLATTATLSAVDTPDTRGWSTLPAKVAIARLRVPAGEHVVTIAARSAPHVVKVNVAKGGYAVVPVLSLW